MLECNIDGLSEVLVSFFSSLPDLTFKPLYLFCRLSKKHLVRLLQPLGLTSEPFDLSLLSAGDHIELSNADFEGTGLLLESINLLLMAQAKHLYLLLMLFLNLFHLSAMILRKFFDSPL